MPAQYQVVFTRRARADLDAIYDYIAKDSPQNAGIFVAKLVQAILNLQQLPKRYPIVKSRRWSRRIVRRAPIWPYLAYYKVDDKQLRVEVITIRHVMRRQP